MPSSPKSSAASQPSTATPDGLEALIQHVAALHDTIKLMEADYKVALTQLLDAHAQGLVRSKFTAYDTDFNLTPGRSSWTYDDDVTDQVKEIQQWAQQNQKATRKVGAPFWTLKRTKAE